MLGFEKRPTDVHVNHNTLQHDFAESDLEQTRALLSHGEALYAKALERYQEQKEVLARAAGFFD